MAEAWEAKVVHIHAGKHRGDRYAAARKVAAELDDCNLSVRASALHILERLKEQNPPPRVFPNGRAIERWLTTIRRR
jgi:hypothetical protein